MIEEYGHIEEPLGVESIEVDGSMGALTSLQVDVPVLGVVGRNDAIFCGLGACGDLLSATTLEPLSYAPAAELELVVVPKAGHDLNLHKNAPTTYAAILDWLDERFPPLPS